MTKLDETDLQILAQLDLNARSTTTEIARELNLSENTVKSRIKYLNESGVIIRNSPIIDFFALGYKSSQFNFKLHNTNTTIEQQITDYLNNSQYVRWFGYGEAGHGIDFISWFKSKEQLYTLWDEFRKNFKPYIKESSIVVCHSEIRSGLPVTKTLTQEKNDIEIGKNNICKINEMDRKIIRILSSNGRATYSTIGKAVGITPAAIKYRIDRLVEKNVIVGFRPIIDFSKYGNDLYRVEFNLNSLNKLKEIEQFVLSLSNVPHLIRNIGDADLDILIEAGSKKQLFSTLNDIKDRFTQDVRDYNLITYARAYKEDFMPNF
jgi:DNA-binding Lrp family transcriptional regulator